MLDTESIYSVREAVQRRAAADRILLDELRAEARALASEVQEIRPRSVGTGLGGPGDQAPIGDSDFTRGG